MCDRFLFARGFDFVAFDSAASERDKGRDRELIMMHVKVAEQSERTG